ncbi:unnamed protein product [Spirodela intermedia]|uniref:Uncharacterized protein n=1 Tax=Spirodela intermedia TaxID=51605 RepID=A0A7I8IL51_SPIIN|nr:unnamed protein product [Spirodela intermedia]CAA6658133.1 unnamed protein product [Spirodela intermedia]
MYLVSRRPYLRFAFHGPLSSIPEPLPKKSRSSPVQPPSLSLLSLLTPSCLADHEAWSAGGGGDGSAAGGVAGAWPEGSPPGIDLHPPSFSRTFSLITLVLVFPLSFAVLAHNIFTHPILHRLQSTHYSSPSSSHGHEWALFFLYQFIYLLFLFTFSLLATAAVVFTVASIYAAKAVSFSSTMSAIRPIFSRLFRTFLWVSLIMLVYNSGFILAIAVVIILSGGVSAIPSPRQIFLFTVIFLIFLAVHVFIAAHWHLASVITVLEPVCGLDAMKKSRELMRGRIRMALWFVLGYLGACGLISGAFGRIPASPMVRVLVGGALVAVLVVVNLVGLLVQSVFYYVCKSYHHQPIDKSALCEHLGGYLGEYVPLKSSIQMENFEL